MAYLAGYVDGEGCFYANAKHGQASLSVANCYPGVLNLLKGVGGGNVYGPYPAFKNSRISYRYAIAGKTAVPLTEALLPYLVEKKKQARLFLDFIEAVPGSATRAWIELELKALKRLSYESPTH